MGEREKLLRFLTMGEVEGKITKFQATGVPAVFTSQLSTENTRKQLSVYNASDSASGDCFYGYHADLSSSGEHQEDAGQPIPVGTQMTIPVGSSINVYFCASSGENADLRVEEIA